MRTLTVVAALLSLATSLCFATNVGAQDLPRMDPRAIQGCDTSFDPSDASRHYACSDGDYLVIVPASGGGTQVVRRHPEAAPAPVNPRASAPASGANLQTIRFHLDTADTANCPVSVTPAEAQQQRSIACGDGTYIGFKPMREANGSLGAALCRSSDPSLAMCLPPRQQVAAAPAPSGFRAAPRPPTLDARFTFNCIETTQGQTCLVGDGRVFHYNREGTRVIDANGFDGRVQSGSSGPATTPSFPAAAASARPTVPVPHMEHPATSEFVLVRDPATGSVYAAQYQRPPTFGQVLCAFLCPVAQATTYAVVSSAIGYGGYGDYGRVYGYDRIGAPPAYRGGCNPPGYTGPIQHGPGC